jgi:hypothetical protein
VRDKVLKSGWVLAGLGGVAVALVWALAPESGGPEAHLPADAGLTTAPSEARPYDAEVATAPYDALSPYDADAATAPRDARAPVDADMTAGPLEARPSLDAGGPLGSTAPLDEQGLLSRLRETADSQPAAALEWVRESERRFPSGRHADERSYLKMRALVHLTDIAAARDEATALFERAPDSPFAEQAYRLTGVHPRPRPPSPQPARR